MEVAYQCLLLFVGIIAVFRVTEAQRCPKICTCNYFRNRRVDCSQNNLHTIPSDIPKWTWKLILQGNDITYLDKVSVANITTVKHLDLQNNNMEKLKPGTFSDMTSLLDLDLRSNLLKELQPGSISNLEKLQNLKLSNNLLTNIDSVISNMEGLVNFDLSNNMITRLTPASFTKLFNLRSLELQNNNISEIAPKTFDKLKKLSYLNLRNNPLQSTDGLFMANIMLAYLDLSECELQIFPKHLPISVRYLHLTKNNISKIDKSDVASNGNLQILSLSQNAIELVEDDALLSLVQLMELWLSGNKLGKIPTISTSVRVFHIDYNEIDCLANGTFLPGSLLEELNLQSNLITDLSNCDFNNIKELKKLYVGTNRIEHFRANSFQGIPLLEVLKLDRNDFKIIEADTFKNLKNLTSLSMSDIQSERSSIKGNIFKPLKKLRVLEVQQSSTIAQAILTSSDMLRSFKLLNELNLMDNSIRTLSPDLLKYIPHLSHIKLSGNPFHCDQRLIWFKQWVSHEEYKFVEPDQLQCYSPDNLRGKLIQGLDKNEFVPTTVPPYLMTTKIQRSNASSKKNVSPGVSMTMEGVIKTANSSSANHSTLQDPQLEGISDDLGDDDDKLLMYILIAVISTLSVIGVICGIVICKICQRKWTAEQEQNQNNKVNFFITKSSKSPVPPPGRLTRSDRGSTTSQPGEDITNNTEPKMKVYIWDNV